MLGEEDLTRRIRLGKEKPKEYVPTEKMKHTPVPDAQFKSAMDQLARKLASIEDQSFPNPGWRATSIETGEIPKGSEFFAFHFPPEATSEIEEFLTTNGFRELLTNDRIGMPGTNQFRKTTLADGRIMYRIGLKKTR